MTTPFLTIAIPVYNGEKYLGQNLDIIGKQTSEAGLEKEIEVIVSDNASTDGTAEVVKEYVAKYDFIRYSRNKNNLGYAGNITKLTDMAAGRFIHFMGDDDFYAEKGLKKLLGILKSRQELAAVVVGNVFYRNSCGEYVLREHLNERYLTEDLFFTDPNEFMTTVEDRDWPVTNIVLRTDYYREVTLPSELEGNDWVHLYELAAIAFKHRDLAITSDSNPIVVDRVDVQTWLNNKDGPRIYYNNILCKSYLDKIGYDAKVFKTYKKWYLMNRAENIKYTRTTHFLLNIVFLKKWCSFYKKDFAFWFFFVPTFLFYGFIRIYETKRHFVFRLLGIKISLRRKLFNRKSQ